MTEDATRILRIYADKYGQAVGMSLVEVPDMRDQFAMAALPALLARHRADVAWSEVAPLSYKIADAMLEARKEKK